MPKQLAVLNIEDSESDSDLIARLFKKAGYEITFKRIETSAQMQVALKKHEWDIIIADHNLPQFGSFAALALLHEAGMDIPFVVVSGLLGEETAVAIMKAGAQDYLLKNDLTRLMPAVERELEYAKLRREHRLAEDELHANERRFRALIENSVENISLLAADGTLLWESPSVIRNLNYAPNQFLNRNIFEIMHPDDLEHNQGLFAEFIKKPASRQSGTFRLKRSDGTWRWVEAVAANMLNEPSVQAIVINYRDVTERIQAEEALRESEARLNTIVQSEPECVKLLGPDGTLLDMNPAGLKMIEADSLEQVQGVSIFKLVAPGYRAAFKALNARVFKGESGTLEFEIIGLKGAHRWLETHAVPFRNANGEVTSLLGITRDITKRRQAEQELRNSEQLFRELADNIEEAFWLTESGNKKDQYISPAYMRIWGRILKDSDDFVESVLPEDQPIVLAVLEKQRRGEKTEIEYRIRHTDGSVHWVWDRAFPIFDASGKVKSVAGIATDVTDRKRAEDALRASESSLQGILQSTADGILAVGIENKVLFTNEHFSEMWNIPKEVISNKDDELLLQHVLDQLTRPQDFLNQVQELYKSNQASFDILHFKDGRIFERSSKPIMDGESSVGRVWSFRDITERKRSEEALRESEERFQSLFNRMMDGVYRSKHEGKFVDVNPAMVKMFGYASREEMLEVDIKNELYFEPEERGSHILDTGQEEMDVYRMRRKDGSEIWVEDHGSYVHDEQGNIIFHEGILRDITDRKRADQVLTESEARFRQAIAAADAIPYSLNYAADHYTFIGEGITKLAGYSLEEMTPALLHSLIVESIMHGRFEGISLDEAVRLVREGKSGILWQCDHRIRTRSGDEHWISDSSIQILDENGIPKGSIGIIQDITERKQIETAAREGEARYRSLFDDSPMALWEEDFSAVKLKLDALRDEGIKDFRAYFALHPQGVMECASLVKIVDVNKAALKLFGIKVKADLLQNLGRFIDDDSAQSFQNELISIAQGKTHFEWEGVNQTVDGRQIILRLTRSVVAGCEDTFSKVIISMMDVTASIKAEQAIRESEKSLRESQKIAGLGSYALDILSGKWTSSDILNQIFGIDDSLTRSVENWTTLIHPDWQQEMADYFANEVLGNQVRFDKEYKIARKNDGAERWVHGLGELEFNDQNQPIKMRGVIQDITERKQAEEKLLHAHQFLQSVQDALSAHIAILDDEGRIVQVNLAWRNFGTHNSLVSPNTCIGMNYLEICDSALGLDAKEAPLIANAIRKILISDEEQEKSIEYPCHSPTEQRWFIARITSFINNKRKWVIVSHENITARKQAEEALSKSEALYRQAIEVAGAVPYYVSYYGGDRQKIQYDFIGEGIRQITGYGPEEFSAAVWESLVEETILVEELSGFSLEDGIQRVRTGETPIWKCEFRIRDRFGNPHWVFEAAVEIRDENGVSHGSIGTYQDITVRKQAENDRNERLKEMTCLYDVRSEMGHDLSSEELCDRIIQHLTIAMKFPEIAAPVIEFEGRKFASKKYAEHLNQQLSAEILIHGVPVGQLQVFYVEEKPFIIPEEQNLINSVAGDLGFWLERKQAEQALREGEQRYRALFEDMPVAIWEEDFSEVKKYLDSLREQGVTDVRTYFEHNPEAFLECATLIRILDVNRATLKMYHADSKEDLYKSMEAGLSESEVEHILNALIAISAAKTSHNWEGVDETVTGELIEVSLSWSVAPEHEADFSKVIVTTIDITERKQSERALAENEKRFRALIANTGDLIVVINKDGIIQFASPSSERILGYSPEEAIGRNFTEWVHPQDLSQVLNSLASRLKETGTSAEGLKARGRHKDGSWRILDTIGTNLIHEPAIQGIVINIRDITERETAEEALRASEAQFRAIFEGAAMGISLVDASGHPLKVNSALQELLGYDAQELRNMIFTEFTHPEDVKMDWDLWQELIAGKREDYQIEKRFIHKDGHIIWVKLTTSAVMSGVDGKISFGVGMIEDISERKKAEAEINYQLAELEALYENGLAISRLLEPKRIAQRMIEVLDQKLDWHHVAIRTYDSSTDHLELLALNSSGFNESQFTEQIERINQAINTPDKGLSGWVIRHGEVVRVGKLQDDRRYIETYAGIKSGLYVPIKSGDEVMGSIAVESEQENAFTERDANTLTTLANQAAIAFVNARLYTWLQKELDERLRVEEQVRKLNVELEQRVAERTAQIEATKRRLELATHAGQIGVWEYNPRENKVIWDERMHMIHQIPTGEFDGTSETWAKLIHPDDIEQSQINRQLAVTKNLLMSNEHRIFWPDGSIRYIMTSAVMAYSLDGTPDRIIGINMDITERKQIERSLRESENYARLLFDSVPDPVSVTETDGLIVDVNKVFEQQYKLVRDEIRGKRISDLGIYPEAELDKRDKYVAEILQEQNVEPIQLEFYVSGNRIHTLELHSYLLMVNGRQLMLNTSHDITLYKKAEETQRIAKSEIERALRIKNEFLANMSHELRTPLNSILGISESLEEQIAGTLNQKQLRYVGIVKESGHHLLDLINDILDLSKIEAGRMELDVRSITVDKLCQSSLRMVKELAQKKSLNISYRLHEEVRIVLGDERRLKQSLVNLLSNAVKFTPAGNRIGLEVLGNVEKNEVKFTVWDQGIGIAQKDIQHLFKPFVQLDGGLTREYQGTGLGLALVSQMAQLHGGRVSVESEAGSGSRFTITLPWLSNEQTSIAKVTGQLPSPSQKSNIKRNGRILLVEDTDLVVQLISDYLRYRGYEVLLAHNGAEGVKLAKEERPDLILMDVMMPVMNGLEAAQKMRADETLQKTPIIAMTALAMAGDSEKCLAAGMNDYLSKPIQMQNLADMIEKYMGLAREKTNDK